MYMFPCLIGVLFLLISEVFVRPQTNQKLATFLSEVPFVLLCFRIVCLFIYFGYELLLDMTIANMFPFNTSFLILFMVPHGESFEVDVRSLVHFSFHFFSFWNYTQTSLSRVMYRNTVPLPF